MKVESTLRPARERSRKLLIPYVTGGLGPNWCDTVAAVAASGADAIEVGIPFSDPVMDGPTAARAIRAAEAATGRAPTPIIALTANVMTHQVEAYRAAGMTGFVAKPINVAELFLAVFNVPPRAVPAASALVQGRSRPRRRAAGSR